MNDIVERLRRENDIKLSFGNDFSDLLLDAAARIEALEAALREIEWHDPKSPAAAAARAALDKDAGK